MNDRRIVVDTSVSRDADYLRMHSAGVRHAGVVYCRQGTSVGDLVRGHERIHEVLEPQDMVGQIEFIG